MGSGLDKRQFKILAPILVDQRRQWFAGDGPKHKLDKIEFETI
jgi:hypothetical protein